MAINVVLVHPEIHWNTGNAGRTCLAAGATLHLVEPLGFSLDEREVRRAVLDYWEQVDLHVWPSWDVFEREIPTLGDALFFSTKAVRMLWDTPLGATDDAVVRRRTVNVRADRMPRQLRPEQREVDARVGDGEIDDAVGGGERRLGTNALRLQRREEVDARWLAAADVEPLRRGERDAID